MPATTSPDLTQPCPFQCESGWLPIDGELDEMDDMLYLIPTVYTPCSNCSPLWMQNEDLEGVYV